MRNLFWRIAVLVLAAAAAQATSIGVNFTAGSFDSPVTCGCAPPDTMGTVGPSHVVEFINGAFSVYNKTTGAQISQISDSAFWTNAGITGGTIAAGLSDPRIIYDPDTSRFFAVQITTDNTGNKVLVAVSNSSDPTAGWKATSYTGDAGFADYPTLGVTPEGVLVGTNNFTNATSSGSFTGVSLMSIPKADLLLATPSVANGTMFPSLAANSFGFTLQPAVNFGASTGHSSIVAVDNDFFSRVDRFNITNVAGPGAAVMGAETDISVAATGFGPQAGQPDGTHQIDTLDDRFSGNVVQVGGNLFMAHVIGVGGHDAIRWTILNEATNAVVGEGTFSDVNFDYYDPSIAVNSFGDVVIGFSRSGTGAGEFISAYARVGKLAGSTLTFGSDILLQAGLANYHLFTGNFERWGDYSAVVVDPNDPLSFWAFQEFAGAGNVWRTQVTQIMIDAVPEPSSIGLVLFGLGAGWYWRRRRA